jgi:hypothetical protein
LISICPNASVTRAGKNATKDFTPTGNRGIGATYTFLVFG